MGKVHFDRKVIGTIRATHKIKGPEDLNPLPRIIFYPRKNLKGTLYYVKSFTTPFPPRNVFRRVEEILQKRMDLLSL